MKFRLKYWNHKGFIFRCGWWLQPCMFVLLENRTFRQPQQSPPDGQ